MNFFRKKSVAYITLDAQDIAAESRRLWADLQFALEGHKEITQVTLKIFDEGDIPLKLVSVIVSMALKLKDESVRCEFVGTPRVVQMLRRLNMASAFAQLTEAN
ncbi:MAG: hypothetical protein JSR44_12685 [Spirochaetes bacterium]|nr:hypothetical protein [Spirochaetota bacterium]